MVDRRSINSFHKLSAFVISWGNLKPKPTIAIGTKPLGLEAGMKVPSGSTKSFILRRCYWSG